MNTRRLTNDGSYTLYSDAYSQTFHSTFGGKTEAEHVFLKNAGLSTRAQQQEITQILEVGFGAGLNFLLTADLALTLGVKLDYWAFEKNLLPARTIIALEFEKLLQHPHLAAWLQSRLVDRETNNSNETVMNSAGNPDAASESLLCWMFNDSLSLHLMLGDATKTSLPDTLVDVVYLDAFSPDKNPELWTVSFFKKLHGALKKDGKLATYSAKSLVRKNLIAAGFKTTTLPGPPGKREMLLAQKS